MQNQQMNMNEKSDVHESSIDQKPDQIQLRETNGNVDYSDIFPQARVKAMLSQQLQDLGYRDARLYASAVQMIGE